MLLNTGERHMPTDRLTPGLKAEIVITVDDKLVVKQWRAVHAIDDWVDGARRHRGRTGIFARRAHHRRLRGERQAFRQKARR